MTATSPAIAALWDHLHELRETLLALRLTVVEDPPSEGGTLVTDRLADEVEAACAELQAAVDMLDRLRAEPEPELAPAALAGCHRHLQTATSLYWLAFAPRQRQRDLSRVVRVGGDQWKAWAQALWSTADGVPATIAAALEALPEAWLAVVSPPGLHVHNTAVGQQLLAATSPQTKETS